MKHRFSRMTSLRFSAVLACSLALALAITALGGLVGAHTDAFAATASVQSVTVTRTYRNPGTGTIEDSGGEKSEALGQSMVENCTDPVGLLETDTAGKLYLTLRLHLADQISDVTAEPSTDGGQSFTSTPTTQTQEDLSHGEASPDNIKDWRFEIPAQDAVVRMSFYVKAMGRSVIYFVTISDPVDGNQLGFVTSVTPGETASETTSDTADAASKDQTSAEQDEEQAAKDSAAQSSVSEGGSTSSGIAEFDKNGNPVDATKSSFDVTPYILGAGVALVVLVAVGVGIWMKKRSSASKAEALKAADDHEATAASSEKTSDEKPCDE